MLTDWRRERRIRRVLRDLSKQRVYLFDHRAPWVIEKAVQSQDLEVASALRTCEIRGWVQVLHDAVPAAPLNADGSLPPTGFNPTHAAPLYRLTEAGWNVVNGIHMLLVTTLIVSVAALAASIVGIIVTVW